MQSEFTTKQLAIRIARKLRKEQTEAEILFWSEVRKRKFHGLKFQRQLPIFFEYYGKKRFFIADFYCCEKHLVVEIDGGIHEVQVDYDRIRTEIMEVQNKLNVIRFSNNEVLNNIPYVLARLNRLINEM